MYLSWKITIFPLQLSMASCATNGGLWGKKLYYRWRASASFPPPCLAVFTATPDVTESWPSTRYLQKCCWFRILHPQWGSLLRPLTPTSHTHNAWWLTGDHARYSRVVANSCYSFYSGFGIFIFFFIFKKQDINKPKGVPLREKALICSVITHLNQPYRYNMSFPNWEVTYTTRHLSIMTERSFCAALRRCDWE